MHIVYLHINRVLHRVYIYLVVHQNLILVTDPVFILYLVLRKQVLALALLREEIELHLVVVQLDSNVGYLALGEFLEGVVVGLLEDRVGVVDAQRCLSLEDVEVEGSNANRETEKLFVVHLDHQVIVGIDEACEVVAFSEDYRSSLGHSGQSIHNLFCPQEYGFLEPEEFSVECHCGLVSWRFAVLNAKT